MTMCMTAHRPSKATGGIAAYGGTAQPGNAEEKGNAAKVIHHLFNCFQWFSTTQFQLGNIWHNDAIFSLRVQSSGQCFLSFQRFIWLFLMLNRQEEERRRREEEMLRKREMEEQMRRQREENYRMGGFMDVSWISRNLIYYCRQSNDANINLVLSLCHLLQREREMRMNSGAAMGLGGKCFFPSNYLIDLHDNLLDDYCMLTYLTEAM